MNTRIKLIGLGAFVLLIGVTAHAMTALSEDAGPSFGQSFIGHGMGHGMMGMGPRMMGMAHDEATMAQLQVIHAMLVNHDRITRTVSNLPNGIRTVTESDDPELAGLIKKHVAYMGKRVGAGDDPGLPIESNSLHAIFRDKDKFHTTYETTTNGIVVLQTSDDPKTVDALQAHTGEVDRSRPRRHGCAADRHDEKPQRYDARSHDDDASRHDASERELRLGARRRARQGRGSGGY